MTLSMPSARFAIPALAALTIASCGGNVKDSSSVEAVNSDSLQRRTDAKQMVDAKAGMVWNGDSKTVGSTWASASKPDLDSISIDLSAETGVESSNSFRIQVAGDNWMGIGYNWLDLWGDEPGLDVSDLSGVAFDIKIDGIKLPSGSNSFLVQFASGGNTPGRSEAFRINSYIASNFTDGNWHTVSVPFETFVGTSVSGNGSFTTKHAREISIAVAPNRYVDLDIFIDNIRFF